MSCAHCGKPGAVKGCSACKTTARYCDEDCQRAHWALHKGPCKETQRAAARAAPPPHRASMDVPKMTVFMTEGMVWSRVALALFRIKKYAKANVWYLRLFNIKLELFGRSDFRTCSTMRDYGESLAWGGALAEGRALIQEAVDHLALQQHPELRHAQDALHDVLALEGQSGAAAEDEPPVCAYMLCGKPADKRCARCLVSCYCSRECQKSDWAGDHFSTTGHKEICKTLKAAMQE